MPTAEFTAKFINPPKPGKKNANIKTDTDDFYLVPPELVAQFTQGNRYKVEYRTSAFQGVTYKYVEKVEPIAGAAAGAGPAPGRNRPGARYQDDIVVAERIFVCGAMNNMMANPNTIPFALSEQNITERVNILREVWRKTFGNPQQDAEMGDEIPFV